MKIKIKIECETIEELFDHFDAIKDDISLHVSVNNLDQKTDELTLNYLVEDDNCYGSHSFKVVS